MPLYGIWILFVGVRELLKNFDHGLTWFICQQLGMSANVYIRLGVGRKWRHQLKLGHQVQLESKLEWQWRYEELIPEIF